MTNREKVIELFKGRTSAYDIMLETGLSSREVYTYIRESEELRARHHAKLRESREQAVTA